MPVRLFNHDHGSSTMTTTLIGVTPQAIKQTAANAQVEKLKALEHAVAAVFMLCLYIFITFQLPAICLYGRRQNQSSSY
jgi:hypothetical protein